MKTNIEKTENTEKAVNEKKTRIYNLIVLDKSGSMNSIRKAAYDGCNEVLSGIRAAAEKHKDDQEQFVSLLLFDTESMPYIYRCTPAAETTNLSEKDYKPCAATPLLDAMGKSLLALRNEVNKYEDAVGMVTIITDGYENASKEFTYGKIQELVESLKQQGWNFAFMGANQDITKVCLDLNINVGNAIAFSFDEQGMHEAWEKDLEAKERYYERMREVKEQTKDMCIEERMRLYCKMNNNAAYFKEPVSPRTTPERIVSLSPDEVFVLGSNIQGWHNGGAAQYALNHFGAVMGQPEGMQGQSYAIPTTGCSLLGISDAVARFTDYAQQHPEKHFLVTAIGCGVAGYRPADIAPMFADAARLQNVSLPRAFWQFLR